eukprot:jgi/Psemu1/289524/fgenesh1_pg.365_\
MDPKQMPLSIGGVTIDESSDDGHEFRSTSTLTSTGDTSLSVPELCASLEACDKNSTATATPTGSMPPSLARARWWFGIGIGVLLVACFVTTTHHHYNERFAPSTTWKDKDGCDTNTKARSRLGAVHRGGIEETSSSSTPRSKYKKVRYFGFQIYTGAAPAFLNHGDTKNNKSGDGGDGDGDDQQARRFPNPECIRPETTTFETTTTDSSTEEHPTEGNNNKAHHTYGQMPLEDGGIGLQCYVGHEDPVTDARERLRILRDAVEGAYEEYQSVLNDNGSVNGNDDGKYYKNEPDVLKIFAAPEFFFRGLRGAYDFTEDPRRLDRIFGFNYTTSAETAAADGDSNSSKSGAFCTEDSPVCVVLMGLQDIVEDKRFEDWLFLFGTVVATQTFALDQDTNTNTKTPATATGTAPHAHHGNDGDGDGSFEYLYYNFAPVYKGFDPTNESEQQKQQQHHHYALGKRFLVPKRYVSTSDFLTPTRDVDWRDRGSEWEELFGPDDDRNGHSTISVDNPRTYQHKRYDDDWFAAYKTLLYEKAGYVQVEYDWLMVDGIAFTVEVCLDHELRTALDAYNGDLVTGRTTRIPSSSGSDTLRYVPIPTHQAQIGLVASAGMSPNTESLALAQNGLLLLQDGLSNSTARRFLDNDLKEQCGPRQEVQFTGGTVAVRRRAKVSKTEVRFEYDLLSSHGDDDNDDNNDEGNASKHRCGKPSADTNTNTNTNTNTGPDEELACEHKVPVYGGAASAEEHWKTNLRGIFSTEVYEPHLVVYGPFDIPEVEV